MNIYKYRPINKNTIESLINNTLYFSPPKEFNDPFDTNVKVDFIGSPGSEIKKVYKIKGLTIPDVVYDDVLKDSGNVNKHIEMLNESDSDFYHKYSMMCCFSKKKDNLLMWSHYANSHKGIVLGFKVYTPNNNSKDHYILDFDDERFKGLTSSYAKNPNGLPVWDVLYKNFKPEKIVNSEASYFIMEKMRMKSVEWSYEEEMRIIFFNPIGSRSVKYKSESLSEIIFGINTTNTDVKLIIDIVDKFYNHSIEYYKAIMNTNEYRVDFINLKRAT